MQTFVAEGSLQCFTASMSETLKLSRNEPHDSSVASRLNWLRAGVLGANDGIVSVAATVVGVAGVTNDLAPILVAGTAAVVGGAVSMALGEYAATCSNAAAADTMSR